jgi:hyperosmotically inducible protein
MRLSVSDAQAGNSSAARNKKRTFHITSSGDSAMKQLRNYLSALFLAVSLVGIAGCASTSKQEGTGEYIDDSVITSKVKAAIFNDPALKVAEINVETFKGVVQLSGFVSSQAAANKAVDLARGVAGVTSVKNDMRIK